MLTWFGFIRKAFVIYAVGFVLSAMAADSDDMNSGNLWDNLRYSFQLEEQYQRPEVQQHVNWLMHHKSYLNQLGAHSQPYMYYILQELKKRDMPGEIALLPMIESTYNPLAYSNTGAAGLWQLTSGTGSSFGLKKSWWFDERRDIHESTGAALDYLAYLHRFFKGNWMLAIAAYHSGEGTVQRAVRNRGKSASFWSLNLPEDTQNYVPKLLALARLIQSKNQLSEQLPYISNTPYFTKIDVGTQIDLTNAANLAGISYPEFLKLNPGNNRWATAPKGPHTIVLPLDKVNVFVRNLEKIPQSERAEILATHAVHFEGELDLEVVPEVDEIVNPAVMSDEDAVIVEPVLASTSEQSQPTQQGSHKVLHVVQKGESFWHLARKYHVKESDIRSWNSMSAKSYLKLGQKLTVWTTSLNKLTPHIIRYKIRAGDSLLRIAQKFNVSLKKLMGWNAALHPKRLIPGKEVLIYQ